METAAGIKETISDKVGENEELSQQQFETTAVGLKVMEAELNSMQELEILSSEDSAETTSLTRIASVESKILVFESDASDKLLHVKDRLNSEPNQITNEHKELVMDKKEKIVLVTEAEVGPKDGNFNDSSLHGTAYLEGTVTSETHLQDTAAYNREYSICNTRTANSSGTKVCRKQTPEYASFKNENAQNEESANSFTLPSYQKISEADHQSSEEVQGEADHSGKDYRTVTTEQHIDQLDTFHKVDKGQETVQELADIEYKAQESASQVFTEDHPELDVVYGIIVEKKAKVEEAELNGNLNLQPDEQNLETDATALNDVAEETHTVINNIVFRKTEIQADQKDGLTINNYVDASSCYITRSGAEVDKGDNKTGKTGVETIEAMENIKGDTLKEEDAPPAVLKAENIPFQKGEMQNEGALVTSEASSEEKIQAQCGANENRSDKIPLAQQKEEEDQKKESEAKINHEKTVIADVAPEDQDQGTRKEENSSVNSIGLKDDIQADPRNEVADVDKELADTKDSSTKDASKATESHGDALSFQMPTGGAEIVKGENATGRKDNFTEEDASPTLPKAENKPFQEGEMQSEGATLTSEASSEEQIQAHCIANENKSDKIPLAQHKEEEGKNKEMETKINNEETKIGDVVPEDQDHETQNEENTSLNNLVDHHPREQINEDNTSPNTLVDHLLGREIRDTTILASEARDLDKLLKDNSNLERGQESHYVSHTTEAPSSQKEVDEKIEVTEMGGVDDQANDFMGSLETATGKHQETSYMHQENVQNENKIDTLEEVQKVKQVLPVPQTQCEQKFETQGSNGLINQEKFHPFSDLISDKSALTVVNAQKEESLMPKDECSYKPINALHSAEASAEENIQGTPPSAEEENATAEENQSIGEIAGFSVERYPERASSKEEIAKAEEKESNTEGEIEGMTVERSSQLYPRGIVSEAPESSEFHKKEMDSDIEEKDLESVQNSEDNSAIGDVRENINETAHYLKPQERQEDTTADEMTNTTMSNEEDETKIDEEKEKVVPQLEPEDHDHRRNYADGIDEDSTSTTENPYPNKPTVEEDTDRKDVEKRDEMTENEPPPPVIENLNETAQYLKPQDGQEGNTTSEMANISVPNEEAKIDEEMEVVLQLEQEDHTHIRNDVHADDEDSQSIVENLNRDHPTKEEDTDIKDMEKRDEITENEPLPPVSENLEETAHQLKNQEQIEKRAGKMTNISISNEEEEAKMDEKREEVVPQLEPEDHDHRTNYAAGIDEDSTSTAENPYPDNPTVEEDTDRKDVEERDEMTENEPLPSASENLNEKAQCLQPQERQEGNTVSEFTNISVSNEEAKIDEETEEVVHQLEQEDHTHRRNEADGIDEDSIPVVEKLNGDNPTDEEDTDRKDGEKREEIAENKPLSPVGENLNEKTHRLKSQEQIQNAAGEMTNATMSNEEEEAKMGEKREEVVPQLEPEDHNHRRNYADGIDEDSTSTAENPYPDNPTVEEDTDRKNVEERDEMTENEPLPSASENLNETAQCLQSQEQQEGNIHGEITDISVSEEEAKIDEETEEVILQLEQEDHTHGRNDADGIDEDSISIVEKLDGHNLTEVEDTDRKDEEKREEISENEPLSPVGENLNETVHRLKPLEQIENAAAEMTNASKSNEEEANMDEKEEVVPQLEPEDHNHRGYYVDSIDEDSTSTAENPYPDIPTVEEDTERKDVEKRDEMTENEPLPSVSKNLSETAQCLQPQERQEGNIVGEITNISVSNEEAKIDEETEEEQEYHTHKRNDADGIDEDSILILEDLNGHNPTEEEDTDRKEEEKREEITENDPLSPVGENLNETAHRLKPLEQIENAAGEMTNASMSNEEEDAKKDEKREPEDHDHRRNYADGIDEDSISTVENPYPDNPVVEEDADRKDVEKRDEMTENETLPPAKIDEEMEEVVLQLEQEDHIHRTNDVDSINEDSTSIVENLNGNNPTEEEDTDRKDEEKRDEITENEHLPSMSENLNETAYQLKAQEQVENAAGEMTNNSMSNEEEAKMDQKREEVVPQLELEDHNHRRNYADGFDEDSSSTAESPNLNNPTEEEDINTKDVEKREITENEPLPPVSIEGTIQLIGKMHEEASSFVPTEQCQDTTHTRETTHSDIPELGEFGMVDKTSKANMDEQRNIKIDEAKESLKEISTEEMYQLEAVVAENQPKKHSPEDTMENRDLNEKDQEPVFHQEGATTPVTNEEKNVSSSLEDLCDVPASYKACNQPVGDNTMEESIPASEELVHESIRTDLNAYSIAPKETIISAMFMRQFEATIEDQSNEPIAESENGKTQKQEEEHWEKSVSDLSILTSTEENVQKEEIITHPGDNEVPSHQISESKENKIIMVFGEGKYTVLDTLESSMKSNFSKSEHQQDKSNPHESHLASRDDREAESAVVKSPRDRVKDKQPKDASNNQVLELELHGTFKDILDPTVEEEVAVKTPCDTNERNETERVKMDKIEATELKARIPELIAQNQTYKVKDITDDEVSNEVVRSEIKTIKPVNEACKTPCDLSKSVHAADFEDQKINIGDLHGNLTSVEEPFQEPAEKNKDTSSFAEVHAHETIAADNETEIVPTKIGEEEEYLDKEVNLSSILVHRSIHKEDEEVEAHPQVKILMHQTSEATEIRGGVILDEDNSKVLNIPEDKNKEASGFAEEHARGTVVAEKEIVSEPGISTIEGGVKEKKSLNKTVDDLSPSNSVCGHMDKEEDVESHPQIKVLVPQNHEATDIKERVILNEETSTSLSIMEKKKEEASGVAEEHADEVVHTDNETIPGIGNGRTELQEENLNKMHDGMSTSDSVYESIQKENVEAPLLETEILEQETSETKEIKENIILNEDKTTAFHIPEGEYNEASGSAEEHCHGDINKNKDKVPETGNDLTDVREEEMNLDDAIDDWAPSNSAHGNIQEEEDHPPEVEILKDKTGESKEIEEGTILIEKQETAFNQPEVKNEVGFAEEHVQQAALTSNENIPETGNAKTEINEEENLDKPIDDFSTSNSYGNIHKEDGEAHAPKLEVPVHHTNEVKGSFSLNEEQSSALDILEEKNKEVPGLAKEHAQRIFRADKEMVAETGNGQTKVREEEDKLNQKVGGSFNSDSAYGSMQNQEEEAHSPQAGDTIHQLSQEEENKERVIITQKQSKALEIPDMKNPEVSCFLNECVHEAVHIDHGTKSDTGTGETVLQDQQNLDKTADNLSTSDSAYRNIVNGNEEAHPPEEEVVVNQSKEKASITESVTSTEENTKALDIPEETNKLASGFEKDHALGTTNVDKETVAETGNGTIEDAEKEESLDKTVGAICTTNSAYRSIQRGDEVAYPSDVELLEHQATQATEFEESVILNEVKSAAIGMQEPNLHFNFTKDEKLSENPAPDMQDSSEDIKNKLESRYNKVEESSLLEAPQEAKSEYPKNPTNNEVMDPQIKSPFQDITEPNTEEDADKLPCNIGVGSETEQEMVDENEAIEFDNRTQEFIAQPQAHEMENNRGSNVSNDEVSSEHNTIGEIHEHLKLVDPIKRVDPVESEEQMLKDEESEELQGIPTFNEEIVKEMELKNKDGLGFGEGIHEGVHKDNQAITETEGGKTEIQEEETDRIHGELFTSTTANGNMPVKEADHPPEVEVLHQTNEATENEENVILKEEQPTAFGTLKPTLSLLGENQKLDKQANSEDKENQLEPRDNSQEESPCMNLIMKDAKNKQPIDTSSNKMIEQETDSPFEDILIPESEEMMAAKYVGTENHREMVNKYDPVDAENETPDLTYQHQTQTAKDIIECEVSNDMVSSEIKVTEAACKLFEPNKEQKAFEPNKVQLSDLSKVSARDTIVEAQSLKEERNPDLQHDELENITAANGDDEEVKLDKEEGDEEDEAYRGADVPVIVEGSRETGPKPSPKKSHNILSGVGSKVKHSIAKVKKVITGKSSHTKTTSTK